MMPLWHQQKNKKKIRKWRFQYDKYNDLFMISFTCIERMKRWTAWSGQLAIQLTYNVQIYTREIPDLLGSLWWHCCAWHGVQIGVFKFLPTWWRHTQKQNAKQMHTWSWHTIHATFLLHIFIFRVTPNSVNVGDR